MIACLHSARFALVPAVIFESVGPTEVWTGLIMGIAAPRLVQRHSVCPLEIKAGYALIWRRC